MFYFNTHRKYKYFIRMIRYGGKFMIRSKIINQTKLIIIIFEKENSRYKIK